MPLQSWISFSKIQPVTKKSTTHPLFDTQRKGGNNAKGHYVLTSLPHVTETGISKLEEMEILGRERKDGQMIHKNSRGSISPGVVVLPMPMPMTQHSRAELASVMQGCPLQQEQRLSSRLSLTAVWRASFPFRELHSGKPRIPKFTQRRISG